MKKGTGWWLRGLAGCAIVATTIVSILFVAGPPGAPGWTRWAAAVLWIGGAAALVSRLDPPLSLLALIALALSIHLGLRLVPASSDGDWALDHARSPLVTLEGDSVHVEHFRSFRYAASGEIVPRWSAERFSLSSLEGCDYVVVPFADEPRLAHTMVSFRFADGRHVTVSVEARREKGEAYSVLRAMLRQFELLYVIGDEEDLIGGRVIARGDTVYLYPIVSDIEAIRRFFVELVQAADEVSREPRWYNTLRSNCTTTLVDTFERARGESVPWDLRILLPGGSAELVYDLGLLDRSRPFGALRETAKVTAESLQGRTGDFSRRIRPRN